MKPFMRNVTAALWLALPACALADGTLYVQSLKAKILTAPAFTGTVVVEVNRGETLTLLENQDRWYKVSFGNKSGWISKLVVSDRAPMNKTTALNAQEGIEMGARRRASLATTAGAARGLTYDDRMRASQTGIANYDALERVEEVQVSEQEALSFLAEGLKQ